MNKDLLWTESVNERLMAGEETFWIFLIAIY